VSESLGALTPLAARNGNQPANRLVRRHYVAKEQKEAVERRRVLLVGPGRVAIGQHDDAIVEHHRITCCGFAAHVSGRACDQQCVDAAALELRIDVRRPGDEGRVLDLLNPEVAWLRLQRRK